LTKNNALDCPAAGSLLLTPGKLKDNLHMNALFYPLVLSAMIAQLLPDNHFTFVDEEL